MKRTVLAVGLTALLGLCAYSSSSFAQQKTVKSCQEEWRANKADNQAKGITEKAYVAQCRTGDATASPPAAPSPAAAAPAKPSPTPAAAPAIAQQKTAKSCQEEWRANKADNQSKGITEKAYVAQCRAGGAMVTPPAAPVPAPAPSAAAPAKPSPAPAPAASAPVKPAPAAATTPTGANEFSTEAQAKSRCPADTVVWVNLKSKIYHFADTKNYGTTKAGAYMCEKDATSQGARAAKNETHP